MKKSVIASAIVMALGGSVAYAGDIITINPDAGGPDPAVAIGALGWQNGNAISINPNGVPVAVGDLVQTYAHAALANVTLESGTAYTPPGLNSAYEWTYVLGFEEVVTSTVGAPPNAFAGFQITAGGTNFFEIYFDATPNSDNLTGKGFNDGTLILSGTILPFDGLNGASTFNALGLGGPLDGFVADNYPGTITVTGLGSTSLLVDVASWNPAYFVGISDFISLDFDAFQNTPYSQQNPSSCFWNGVAYIDGAGPISGGTAAQTAAQCAASSIGAINGVTGPNFMFETRSSSAFEAVPEPASLALLGVGLLGLGLARRRKA